MEKVINNESINKGEHLKNFRYKDERLVILNKLFKLLNMTEENKKFTAWDVSDSVSDELEKMLPDIRKYFAISKWFCLKKNDKCAKSLSTIKHIFKDMKLKVNSYTKKIKVDGISKSCTFYEITTK